MEKIQLTWPEEHLRLTKTFDAIKQNIGDLFTIISDQQKIIKNLKEELKSKEGINVDDWK